MSKHIIQADWSDVPHLSARQQAELWGSIPRYQREARTKGVPQLGSGIIYPFEEDGIKVDDFELPSHWPRCFALDAQPLWKSSVNMAFDREGQAVYIYRVFKRAECEPSTQAAFLQAVGDWIPGVGDASGLVKDAERLRYIELYEKWLDIELADRRAGMVETGIEEVYSALSENRLFVFQSCKPWFEEFRMYHRDDKGRIVKKNDHLMDCTRYGMTSGLKRAIVEPSKQKGKTVRQYDRTSDQAWQGM